MRKSIYSKNGFNILCWCPKCGHMEYIDQHGVGQCPKGHGDMENIPYENRDMSGMFMISKPKIESNTELSV